jgi:UDP-GlcNAc:undecaprenyl-phosphate/decaprenyl-phosphate GlcNAc-1-phosphate transferase
VHASWFAAFVVASVIAVTATPLLRRVALRVGFVDVPAAHKSHSAAMPYLGGVAIAGATLAGWLFESSLVSRMGVVALAAVAIAVMGLVDDHRKLTPWVRLAAEGAAAAAVVGAGVRAEVTSIAIVDIAITILWIIGVTNAFNLLDNMDGLSAGTAAVAAMGVFALAAIEGQRALATVAIALCGACIGFLVHNWRPASIFMGDAGALFIGFVLSVAVLDLHPALPHPESLAVPALLLALPVLDTSVVSIARARRGRSLMSGGKDHLSHRLVTLGVPPSVAVAVLVTVEGTMAALAVLSGGGVMPVWSAAAIAVTAIAVLAAVSARADVYGEAPVFVPAHPWPPLASAPRRADRELVSVAHHGGDIPEP